MTESKHAEKPPEFWEAVGHDYYSGLPLKAIGAKHRISIGEFTEAKTQLGWRRRSIPQVGRKRLIRRMFVLLDVSVTELEIQMRKSLDAVPEKTGTGKQTAARSNREVLVLNRLAVTLGKLIEMETTTTETRRPRHSRQMLDVRDKLVRRIEELKRQ